jgi:hypothetical protein
MNFTLVRNHSHKVRVAIGAEMGVESVDFRKERRAQDSANDYLESLGRQRMSFQLYYGMRGAELEPTCKRASPIRRIDPG